MKQYKGKHRGKGKSSNTRTRKQNIAAIFLVVGILIVATCLDKILAYFTSKDSVTNIFSIRAEYEVIFHANDGTQTTSTQTISYNVSTPLDQNPFTYQGYIFNGWNTESDGSGTAYTDEQSVLNISGSNQTVDLYAQWQVANGVAEINGVIYRSLQDAIDAVSKDDVEVTIKLLQDTSEILTVYEHQNITFNLQNNTITNDGGNPVIENFGTLRISNGTVKQTSVNAGAINNKSTGTLLVSGGNFIMEAPGGKQALFNDGGVLKISGNPYMYSISTQRPTVHNKPGGTLEITGGTIISTGHSGVGNEGTLTIGTEDGTSNKSSPMIQGSTYGVTSNSLFDYYDGILKGKTDAVGGNGGGFGDTEDGYNIVSTTEVINGKTYKVKYQAITNVITLDKNDGSGTTSTINVENGQIVEEIPTPTRARYNFLGWYTLPEGGVELDPNGTYNSDVTYYAHWEDAYVAEINGVRYATVQDAINAVPANTQTTVRIISDTQEAVNIARNKNVILDIQNHTMRNNGATRVIDNYGTLTIISGTITSSTTQGAINNESSGKLTITGGRIEATGTRQAIYNNGGQVEITGTAYLSATSTERAAVQNLANGSMTITGGTIVSTGYSALVNAAGTVTVGIKDNDLDVSSPVFQGKTYGIDNSATLNFYDGISKGKTNGINGTITDIEENCVLQSGSEQIGGENYKTAYLVEQ